MVSKFDVFYVIATKGEINVKDIVNALNKPKSEYNSIFNQVMTLETEGLVYRKNTIKVLHTKKSERLFNLISFCIRNQLNYNLLLKKSMFDFIKKAASKEFFTISDIKVHPLTFRLYTDALFKYGFLLIISRKPLKSKLLRHHFFFDFAEFLGEILTFYTPKKHNIMPYIEKELLKYNRNRKVNYHVINEAEKRYSVNFIYSSLNLEGNPLTLPETQKLIFEEIIPKNRTIGQIHEVTNYKNAVDTAVKKISQKEKLSVDTILLLHKIAMASISGAGEIRKQNVVIKNNKDFKTSDFKEIKKKLESLLKNYYEFEFKKKKHI